MGTLATIGIVLLATSIGIGSSWFIRPKWLKAGPLVAVIALMTVWLTYFTVAKDASAPSAQVNPKITIEMPSSAPIQSVAASPSAKFDNTAGWGPARPTFSDQSPAPYAVFNSIIDSGAVGDERSFIRCHDEANPKDWNVNLVALDGHSYECSVNFNNDVADNLDVGNSAADLHDARLSVYLPDKSIYNAGITAYLSASNAQTVWATCNFLSPRPMRFIYQYGSAQMYTNGTPKGGLQLMEKLQGNAMIAGLLVSPGVLLGYSQEDGIVRHSYQYSGYVYFDFKIELDPGQ